MLTTIPRPMMWKQGRLQEPDASARREGTIAHGILKAHDLGGEKGRLSIRFDGLASHDITYVGILQTARASGMTRFPLPYVLTCCHNSLCAVGGTINEDDHRFGLSAAVKYGGIFVPPHLAVIHQYMREEMAGCGRMLLGSDSHTRYGPIGTMGVGEGGPELVKQLLGRTYDLGCPEVVAVHLTGSPRPGVGPQDVALGLVAATFEKGLAKNKVLEFLGDGVGKLPMDFRNGIDVMTTETTCLSSIWETDESTREYLAIHGREGDYRRLSPEEGALYDSAIEIDLSEVVPMIALPFHPSRAYPIAEFKQNAGDLLREVEKDAERIAGRPVRLTDKAQGGKVYVDQGVIAGCSGGTWDNLCAAAEILQGKSTGTGAFSLSVYPASQPQMLALIRSGGAATLMEAGATLRSAFCGPCFGAGDVPANDGLSIRHCTRNFPNREGAKPSGGQMAGVGLMDARSVAATAAAGGVLTGADELPDAPECRAYPYAYDKAVYRNRVYNGWGSPKPEEALVFGPNIEDWPEMIPLPENLCLRVASAIYDPVTTTDELIPSGETSSYRSNPKKLAEFTLSRKDPGYVGRAKALLGLEEERRAHRAGESYSEEAAALLSVNGRDPELSGRDTGLGSLVFALKPGDGSAREQAASCQRVLGGCANIAGDYATRRYRANCVNWGILPFVIDEAKAADIRTGDAVYIPRVRERLLAGEEAFPALLLRGQEKRDILLRLPGLTGDERDILLSGCLINQYAGK